MRIDGNRGVGRTGPSTSKTISGPSGFSEMIGTPKVQASTGGLPISPLASIIGIADADPDGDRRRKAVRHAHSLLDDLEGLYRAICLGTIDQGALQSLAAKLEQAPEPTDPELADLLGQIQVRLAVELAKHAI